MAAETPLPLTQGEHLEMGREIKRATARIRELGELVASVYGPNSQVSFDFEKAVAALERLQSDMEKQALCDLPGLHLDGMYR